MALASGCAASAHCAADDKQNFKYKSANIRHSALIENGILKIEMCSRNNIDD